MLLRMVEMSISDARYPSSIIIAFKLLCLSSTEQYSRCT